MGRVKVLVAPDSFGGTLTAVEAAEAIARGWRRHAPGDAVETVPMSDGGAGFVDVLHASLGGEALALTVADQRGDPTPAAVLVVGDEAYVESAQACGRRAGTPDPEHASSRGLGELVVAAARAGARRVVVGLGDTVTLDGGAGMLAALGAVADPPEALLGGAAGLRDLVSVRVDPAVERLAGCELVYATDVDTPLLGLRGAANVGGAERGLPGDRAPAVDENLERLAAATDRAAADRKGAGAAGGLGFACELLGGRRVDGVRLVAEATGLARAAAAADLVVTGEGSFDFRSRSGKVPFGVAQIAAQAIRPCVVLAGEVTVGSREMRALGIEAAHAVVDLVGREAALAEPAAGLSALAERVARSWSR